MNKISPEEYRKILDGIELQNIILKSSKSNVNHDLISENLVVSFTDKASFELIEDGFVVENKYVISAKNKEKKTVLKIEGIYIVIFKSKTEITDEFFSIYKDISLPLTVWPFFREFVYSITSRMNIPPLTLPLLKR